MENGYFIINEREFGSVATPRISSDARVTVTHRQTLFVYPLWVDEVPIDLPFAFFDEFLLILGSVNFATEV